MEPQFHFVVPIAKKLKQGNTFHYMLDGMVWTVRFSPRSNGFHVVTISHAIKALDVTWGRYSSRFVYFCKDFEIAITEAGYSKLFIAQEIIGQMGPEDVDRLKVAYQPFNGMYYKTLRSSHSGQIYKPKKRTVRIPNKKGKEGL